MSDEARDARRLRAGLDRELAGLAITDGARRRLREGLARQARDGAAAAGARGGTRGGTGPVGRVTAPGPGRPPARRLRWPVPVVAATVVALAAAPGLVARSMRPVAPSTTPTTLQPGGGAVPGPAPAATATAPGRSPTPSALPGTGGPELVVTPRAARPGETVTAAVVLAPASQPVASDGTPPASGRPVQQRRVAAARSAGLPVPDGTTAVGALDLDWGDGATDDQRLRCPGPSTVPSPVRSGPAAGTVASSPTSGEVRPSSADRAVPGAAPAAAPSPAAAGPAAASDVTAAARAGQVPPFSHVYRRPGTYRVVVVLSGGCWATPQRLTATVTVR